MNKKVIASDTLFEVDEYRFKFRFDELFYVERRCRFVDRGDKLSWHKIELYEGESNITVYLENGRLEDCGYCEMKSVLKFTPPVGEEIDAHGEQREVFFEAQRWLSNKRGLINELKQGLPQRTHSCCE